MTTIESSILINATVQEVTAVAYDASRMPEWYVGMTAARPDDVYPEPGGKVDVEYEAAGVAFKTTMTSQILESREDGSAFMQDTLEGTINGISRWTYQAEGDRTRLTAAFDYEIPGGALGQLVDKLIVERVNAENLEKSLGNLKALVETAVTAKSEAGS